MKMHLPVCILEMLFTQRCYNMIVQTIKLNRAFGVARVAQPRVTHQYGQKATRFSEMGVFCEKFPFLKEIFPKLRHLTKKNTASEATFWACSDMWCSNFHAGNRNKRHAGFLLRIFFLLKILNFFGHETAHPTDKLLAKTPSQAQQQRAGRNFTCTALGLNPGPFQDFVIAKVTIILKIIQPNLITYQI